MREARARNETLMRRVQHGDVRAFESFYDGLWARAFGMARTVCRDAGRAEEVVQEAFAAVWKNRGSYDAAKGNIESWVFRIVHNRAVDSIRREAPHQRRRSDEELLAEIEAPGSLADGQVDRSDAEAVRHSLRNLPQAQQKVILLAYFGDLTHHEIAGLLELPAGTVKGRMRLGLEKLRDGCDGGGLDPPG